MKVEVDDEDEDEDDAESAKSVRMEMVEVIKLHMSMDMPEGWLHLISWDYLCTSILECIQYSFNEEFYLGLHPHKMDLIMVAKVRPTKVPNPSTKKDGRKEVCHIVINVNVFLYH